VDIYEPEPRNSAFSSDGVLFRAGDRIRYYPVSPLRYEEIWDAVQAGTYKYEITDEVFDVAAYLVRIVSKQAN
jgi:hypothetical protein